MEGEDSSSVSSGTSMIIKEDSTGYGQLMSDLSDLSNATSLFIDTIDTLLQLSKFLESSVKHYYLTFIVLPIRINFLPYLTTNKMNDFCVIMPVFNAIITIIIHIYHICRILITIVINNNISIQTSKKNNGCKFLRNKTIVIMIINSSYFNINTYMTGLFNYKSNK